MPSVARSASPSTRPARCWSPTTSATRSGESPRPAADALATPARAGTLRASSRLLFRLRPVLDRGERLLDVAARVQALVVVDHLAVGRDHVRDAVGVFGPER